MSFRKIFVPLDGSEAAERALDAVLSLVRSTPGATILLARFLETQQLSSEYSVVAFDSSLEEMRAECLRYLEQISNQIRRDDLAVHCVVCTGSSAEAIVASAREHCVDLIVMSCHRQTGFVRWFRGGLEQAVLRRSSLPVLFLPQDYLEHCRATPLTV